MLVTVNLSCIGKDKTAISNNKWQQMDITPLELIRWQYIAGRAIAPGLFDLSELKGETTQKTNKRWLGSQIVIVDIDDYDGDTLADAIDDVYINRHCVAAYPSSSYTPGLRKYHFVFYLSDLINDAKTYRRLAKHISRQFPMPTDGALTRQAQGVYGTVFTKFEHTKTVDDGLCYLNADAYPVDTIATLRALAKAENESGKGAVKLTKEQLNTRAEKHYEQTPETQERVTLDALGYALKGWGRKSYDEWLQLCFGAHDGCNNLSVMQAIIDSDEIAWQPGERQDFATWWPTLQPGDVTVSSLFYFARQNGWLQTTSVDLKPGDYQTIEAESVRTWLAEHSVPARALIVSPTGTAKTLGAIATLKRLGTPKSVFFAPSIKLCTDLSAKLTSAGVENTLYIDAGNTKDADTLQAANVLVTTLQTFAIKLVSKGVDLSDYKYVVIDESDELVGAFVRSGVGKVLGMSSHVSRLQSQWGMYALSRIMQEVPHVLLFDATATRLSLNTLRRFCPLKYPPVCYYNTVAKTKAPVIFLRSVSDARRIALEAALQGHSLVVAADTKKEAELISTYLLATGAVSCDEMIVITGNTHYDARVLAFLSDVEAGAKQYRVVIYNSAMGSGVSITGVTPDVFVQVATYVSPRKNLQILNRYRSQNLVFAYVPGYESLYHETLAAKLKRLDTTLSNETVLLGAKYQERVAVALDIKALASLSVRDEYEQRRAPRDLYTALLERDGRSVSYHDAGLANDEFKATFKAAYKLLADRAERVLAGWRSVPPISRETPPDGDADAETIAKGLLHARIDRAVDDVSAIKIDDVQLALIVLKYGRYIYNVERWLKLGKAVGSSLDELSDDRRADVTLRLYIGRLELVGLVGLLIPDVHAVVEIDSLTANASKFVREIRLRAAVFDSIAGRQRKFADEIAKTKSDDVELAIAYAKVILKSLGLSLKRKNGKRDENKKRRRAIYCAGAKDVLQLLAWRGTSVDTIPFDASAYDDALTDARAGVEVFNELDKPGKREITTRMREMDATLEAALLGTHEAIF